MGSSKTLQNILGMPQGVALQAAIMRKAASPSLDGLDDHERALRFIRSNLRGSYLFARFLVPSYAGAVFSSLTKFPPIDDELGPLISSIVDVVRGELTNNNVFERSGECHAHYHDALEAYEAAYGDMPQLEIDDFHRLESERGIHYALDHSSLWSPGSRAYARSLRACCRQPLATFILMSVNEELAPKIYDRVLASLSRHPRFDKFRHFIERHVQFDATGHGPVTLEWLECFISMARVGPMEVQTATELVLKAF